MVLRRVGVRPPAPVGAVLAGLTAMASTTSIAASGVSDPGQWCAADRLSDLAPNLG